MQFTGTELLRKREFYTQNTNFEVFGTLSLDDSTSSYTLGVSGDNGVFELKFESGKIWKDDILIHSYLPYETFDIGLEINSHHYNISKNFSPLINGAQKESGNYNYLYFARSNTGTNAEFDLFIGGDNEPNYIISREGLWLNTGQSVVTGYFINNSPYPIRIFNSNVQSAQTLDFFYLTGFLNEGQTGLFRFSGSLADYNAFNFDASIFTNFFTNFNTQSINFYIRDARSLNRFVYLQPIDSFGFNPQNQINRTLNYNNYSGGFITNNFDAHLIFKIEYVSGSGDFEITDFATGGFYSVQAYATNILKSGLLTGESIVATGNSTITGIYIIHPTQFIWATGAATGYFSGLGVGIGTGEGYSGIAYAPFTGIITGLIRDGSGTFNFNGTAVGYAAAEGSSANYTGFVNATGYADISNFHFDDYFYIGVENIPIIKGVQFMNLTGLVYYLSGAPVHKVNSYTDGNLLYLEALASGAAGNGIFVRSGQCNYGPFYGSDLTGGENIGSTGVVTYDIGQPFTGFISQQLTGLGNYSRLISGSAPGIFQYTRTFTGVWDLLTGLAANQLVSCKDQGFYTSNIISGQGTFSPNSNMIFQINHADEEFNIDQIRFIISGNEVFNPLVTIITQ